MVSSQAVASILSNKARLALGLGAAATAVYSSVYTVKSGQRAVVVDRFHGSFQESVGEGTHFRIPWIQKPYILDVRARPHTFSSVSANRDREPVNITFNVLSRPDTQRLPTIVQNVGVEYDNILPSIAKEVLDSVAAESDSLRFFLGHSWYSDLFRDTFVQRAKDFNILIDDVHITHFSSTDNPRVFEQKLVAPREEQENYILTMMKNCQRGPGKCTRFEVFGPDGPSTGHVHGIYPLYMDSNIIPLLNGT